MESLDKLSDDQIRVRLSQYGFGNLPVTDTTRKVLIKKLQKAIDGESTKGRRETVAVSKFSSDEEPEKAEKVRAPRKEKTPNRRATVANAKSFPEANGLSGNGVALGVSKVVSDPPARRASRNTPAKEKPVTVTHYVPVLEDTDDDVPEVLQVKPRSTSRNSTPTMGKSQTVRTSYATDIKPVEEYSGEEVYSVDEEEEELPPPRKPVTAQTVTRRNTSSSTITMKAHESNTPSKLGRATLGTSYTPPRTTFTPPRTTYTSRTYSSEQEKDELLELNESNTPYLSDFAKRLSTITAEPLDAGMDKYRKNLQTEYKPYERPTTTYNYARSTPAPKPIERKQGGFFAGLSKVFDTLDRQYNLYTILYVVLIVMLIVALIVVFL